MSEKHVNAGHGNGNCVTPPRMVKMIRELDKVPQKHGFWEAFYKKHGLNRTTVHNIRKGHSFK